MSNSQVWISITIKHETDSAILVDHGMKDNVWIPKSQILDYEKDYIIGDTLEIELPEWLALDKGMI